MNGDDQYPESSRSLDDLWQMRLLLLMSDMVDGMGKVKAGKALGVNYRTLDRAAKSGRFNCAAAHAHPGQTGTLRAVCPTRASCVSLVAMARPSGGFRRAGNRLHRPQRRRDSTGPRGQQALHDARLWVDIGYRVLLRGPVGC